MYRIELRKIDGAIVAILAAEMAERLKVKDGGALLAIERNGELVLAPYDADFEEAMRVFDDVRREYRNAFRELAG